MRPARCESEAMRFSTATTDQDRADDGSSSMTIVLVIRRLSGSVVTDAT